MTEKEQMSKVFNCSEYVDKYMKVWNTRNVDEILALYSDDTIYIHPGEEPKIIKGKSMFRKYLEKLFETYPYHKLFLVSYVCDNKSRIIMIEWKVSAVFSGSRYGISRNGAKIESDGVDVLELDENYLIKITRTYYDINSIKEQLARSG